MWETITNMSLFISILLSEHFVFHIEMTETVQKEPKRNRNVTQLDFLSWKHPSSRQSCCLTFGTPKYQGRKLELDILRELHDGGGVRHGDHLPPHKYIKNT